MDPTYFIVGGIVWLLVALVLGVVIGRAARLGEGQYIVDDEEPG